MFNQYLLQVTKTKWLMKFYPFTVIHVVSLAKLSCLYFNLKFEPILIVLTVNIFLTMMTTKTLNIFLVGPLWRIERDMGHLYQSSYCEISNCEKVRNGRFVDEKQVKQHLRVET